MPAKLLHTQKKSSMIIGHYYVHLFVFKLFISEAEECDVTQFNQINLNSYFCIGLLIDEVINFDLFTEVKTIVKI